MVLGCFSVRAAREESARWIAVCFGELAIALAVNHVSRVTDNINSRFYLGTEDRHLERPISFHEEL